MARFVFQLEGVLRRRKDVETEKQRALAVIEGRMQALKGELAALDQSAGLANRELRENHLVGRLDMGFITAHRRFIAGTQRQAIQLVQKMALAQKQMDEARRELGEAAKSRKMIEKLRERQFDAYRQQVLRVESAEQDEIGQQLAYDRIVSARLADEGL
jgi:flagellar FliJ protein